VAASVEGAYIEYPFPLRPGVMARLILPTAITREDVRRLSAFMSMLVVGGDLQESKEVPGEE
jgi:hypothetical protein